MISKERFYCVYKHTFPNRKVYIGITCKNPIYRWNNGNGYKKECNLFMFNAIKKYGWNNIKHDILFDKLSKEEACKKEIELISFYRSNQRKYGYNLMSGGTYGRHSEETKKKISICQKGKHLSNETKIKISKSLKMLYKDGVPQRRKPVCQFTKSLKFIRIFNSIAEAENETHIYSANISACCKGKRKSTGGYIWQYQKIA